MAQREKEKQTRLIKNRFVLQFCLVYSTVVRDPVGITDKKLSDLQPVRQLLNKKKSVDNIHFFNY